MMGITEALHSLGGLLIRLGIYLQTYNVTSATSTNSSTCAADSCAAAETTLSWFDKFGSLPEVYQGLVIIPLSFLCFLAFVFAMPRAFDWVMGDYLLLPPVDLPSVEGDFGDKDVVKAGFSKEDVAGLLVSDKGDGDENVWECFDAGDGSLLGYVKGDDGKEEVDEKVRKARYAQEKWKDVSFGKRRRVLKCLQAYVLREHERICEVSCKDTGKVMLDAYFGEIVTTLEKLRWVCDEGERWIKPEKRSTGPLTGHKQAWLEFWPLGVIGAIAPWNYPFHNFMNPVIAALFTGNAVVVKPSEYTIYSSVYFTRIVRRALTVCGHSPELIQVLIGGPDVGQALVESDIDKLFFTGSTKVGKMVALSAAKRLLPVVLELGGKDAFVVCNDANMKIAVELCMRGVYQNSGQNCIGVERVYVQHDVKKKWLERVLPIVDAMRIGVDVGAITLGTDAVKNIQELIDDAVRQGAKVLRGGKQIYPAGKEKAAYYAPTVLDGVTSAMRISHEEIFGPVMCIYEFENDDQVCEEVNKSRFGLSASVFSGNTARANRILARIRTGMGNVNDFGINYLCQSLPFGGTKESGSDRFAGVEGLRGCCLMKSVTRNRPWLPTISQPAHFKYPTSLNAFAFAAALNDLMYNTGWLNKIDNVRNLVVMFFSRKWQPRCVGSGWIG
eukprot:Plantae.Rhodophyta-Hildenbrandia_rubra.ctg1723.p1 GENE.Plantae.Rhodophyta-Hildenbrandia_rubra.ctg1723~~Plantae.Rhodophyta-Hildenbrandia_rubra.ctg1723.p1  ORF type:complete len:669 (-),score=111.60 Plantae.Rhodophyta-Hildenbrandia_rubra.ctg1723:2772-4778(-)